MGIFGTGNFEEDAAVEYLVEFAKPILDRIETSLRGDEDELTPGEWVGVVLLADVEILATLAEGLAVGSTPGYLPPLGLPEESVVEAWRDKYMSVWERSIDGSISGRGDPRYKCKRRRAILYTFQRLALAALREHTR